MHDLQLVGFTTDRRGLIFRPRAGARSEAGFVVPVTDELISLVAQLAAEGASSEPAEAELAVEPAPDAAVRAVARPRSQLSVRDIQARLRAGEPIARVAAEAGVEDDWIERFAPPIRAEQRRIIDQALGCHLRRSRSPASAAPLRGAVGRSLADKGIAYTVDAFEAAWSAHLIGHDRWAVSFTFRHRGRDRTATWTYDAAAAELTTTDRTAAQLGFVAPGAAREDDGQAVDGLIGDPDAKTQIGTASADPGRRRPGARTGRSSRPSSGQNRSAPAGAPETPTAKKAVAKKATAKKAVAKKAATKKRAARKKAAPKRAAAKKVAPRRAAAKTSAPKNAAPKKAAGKKAAPKKAVAKKAAVKKAAPRKVVAKKAAVEKAGAKRAATKNAAAKKAATPTAATEKAAPKEVRAQDTSATHIRSTPGALPAGAVPATRAADRSRPSDDGARDRPPPEASVGGAKAPPRPRAQTDAPRPSEAHLSDRRRDRVATPPPARPAPPEPPVPEATPSHLPDEPPPTGADPRPRSPRPGRVVAGRPGDIPIADVPLAPRPPATNGRPVEGPSPGAPDPAAERRARAAERHAPTVQFRSGSAAPVRPAGTGPDGAIRRSPEPDPRPQGSRADGAADAAARRRRQLRAR